MSEIETKLAALGIELPKAAAPIASYVGALRSGNLVYVSGQLCFGTNAKLVATGKLGGSVTLEAGQFADKASAKLVADKHGPLGQPLHRYPARGAASSLYRNRP